MSNNKRLLRRYSLKAAISAAMILLCAGASVPAYAVTFADSGQSLGSSQTISVFGADVDGDGDIDFIQGNLDQANKIWLNDGNGVFTDSGQSLGSSATRCVFGADIDGDGDIDFIEGNQGQANKIWLNDGFGVFTDSGQSLGSSNTMSVFGADVDNDGDIDFIEGNDGQVNKIWLNNGSGVFADSGQSLGSSNTKSVFGADVNGDGDIDFIEGNQGQANKIWLNDGFGVFTDSGQSLGSGATYYVFGADIDGDGDIDFIEGNLGANKIWLNDGAGVFTDSGQSLGSSATFSVFGADVDGDGDIDIIEGNGGPGGMANKIWLNNGSGVFTDSSLSLGSNDTLSVFGADVDGDGDIDFIEGNVNGDANKIWTNTTNHTNDAPTAPTLTALNNPSNTTITFQWSNGSDTETSVDLLQYDLRIGTTSDGCEVFCGTIPKNGVAAGPGNVGHTLSWTWKTPQFGTYYWSVRTVDSGYARSAWAPEESFTIKWINSGQSLGSSLTQSVYAADVDNDGDLDFIAGNGNNTGPQSSKVWINDGTGHFTDSGQSFTSSKTYSVFAGDVDNDGDLDVVEGNWGTNKLWLNNGAGSFTDSGQSMGSSETWSIYLADLDGDGDLDIVEGNNGANKILLNDGTGNFSDSGQNLGAAWTTSIYVIDVDNDGDLDFMEGIYNNQANKIWLNDGTGNFADSGASYGWHNTHSVFSADLDNDGYPDMVVGNASLQNSETRRNNGSGSFSTIMTFGGTDNSLEVFASDVDNDGDRDIISGNIGANKVWINNGTGNVTNSGEALGSYNTRFIFLADIDNDGDLDIIDGNNAPNEIWLNGEADLGNPNNAPSAPTLTAHSDAISTTVTFQWSSGLDTETPSNGLTYNLRVGTSPGSDDIFSGFSSKGRGNVGHTLTWTLKYLPEGTIYWSVQTYDAQGTVSTWVVEDSFIIDITLPSQSNWNPAKGSTITTTSPTITFDTDENTDCKWSLSDHAYGDMTGDCAGDGTTSQSCATAGLSEGAEIVYIACRDTLGNQDTIATNEHVDYTIDATPPNQSAWNPAKSAKITTTSPTITFTTNENSDCKWSLADEAYGTMVGDCTGDGTTSQSCITSGLSEGAEIVYIACRDTLLNADTIATNEHVDYTVDTNPPTFSGAKGVLGCGPACLQVYWDPATDAQSGVQDYRVYMSTAPGFVPGPGNWQADALAGNISYMKTGLGDGTTYYFKVRARDTLLNEDTNVIEKSRKCGGATASNFTTPTSPAPTLGSGAGAYLQWQANGAAAGDQFGYYVSTAGDVNGDGKDDFIVGAWENDPGGLVSGGSAYVYDGATGSIIYEKNCEAAGDLFGGSVSTAGDVNGDGKDDFIISAQYANPGGLSNAGSTYVFDGATGNLLYHKNGEAIDDSFGVGVSTAGDVNGDGKADFIVGAHGANPGGVFEAGSTFVYDGATGNLLYRKDGEATLNYFGRSVSTAGDVDGDGRDDFIVGANKADPGGLVDAGSAYVYSGATGNLLYQKNGELTGDYFGHSVSTAGDVNGDGRDDFIIGANLADPGGLVDAGSAYVYSGATGNLLYQKNGAVGDRFSHFVASAGDVNGDGKDDFIVGAYATDPTGLVNAGSAYVYDGATGNLIFQIDNMTAGDQFGVSVSPVGDVNGDGRADFIVGAFMADPGGLTDAGSAYLIVTDFIVPAVTDNQTGDDTWRTTDPGAIYNVDFSDTGGSNLKNVQYTIWSGAGMTGSQLKAWTDIATGINAATYTTNWGVDWAALQIGTNYVSVRAYDNAGNVSVTTTDAFYIKKDTTAPSAIATVNDGSGVDITYTGSTTELSANWSVSADAESGIDYYEYGIGTTAGAVDTAPWTSAGVTASVTRTGLSLTNGQVYYFTVRAYNGAGLVSAATNSSGVTVATDYPTGGSISYTNGYYTTTSVSLTFNQGTSPSGIASIQVYRQGAALSGGVCGSYDASAALGSQNLGNTAYTDTTVISGNCYKYFLRVTDNLGHEADFSSSNTAKVDTSIPASVASVNDGTGVDVLYVSSTSQLSANWTAASDAQSGIAKYLYAIGTTSGGVEVVDWTENGAVTSFTKTGLTLTNGATYYVSVKAVNGAGLESAVTSSNGVIVDTTAPDVPGNVDDGGDWAESASTLTCSWSASSDAESGIAAYQVALGTSVGADNVVAWTDNGTSLSKTFGSLSLQAGHTYYCSVKVVNGSGLVSNPVSSNGIELDLTGPALTITSPANGLITNQSTVTVSGSTESGAAVTVNGNNSPNSLGSFSTTATLQLGSNTITVTATDAAGNQTTVTRTVTYDPSVPSLNVTYPASDIVTNQSGLTVTGTTDAGVTLTINGQSVTVNPDGSFSKALTLTTGVNTITVIATGASSSTSQVTRTVTLDQTPPSLSVTSHIDGFLVKTASLAVSGTVEVGATVTINGSPVVNSNGSFSANISLTEGANTITVVATDAAGNTTTVTVNGTLDTTAPALTVISPIDGLITSSSPVTISGTTESGSTLTVNGTPVTVTGGNFSTTVAVVEGNNTITVVATDAAGNTTTITRTVNYNTNMPQLTVTSPANGLLTGTANITVTGTTEVGATVTVNGTQVDVSGTGTFSGALTLDEGENEIQVISTHPDYIFNATVNIIVALDTTAPVIQITYPVTDGTVSGLVTVTGTATDASFESYLLEYGPGASPTAWKTIVESASPVTNGTLGLWDATRLKGTYTLRLTATDTLGHQNAVTVTFQVNNLLDYSGIILPHRWVLRSMPVTPSTPVLNIFNGIDWRVYIWDEDTTLDQYHMKYVKPTTLTTGDGFFVRSFEGNLAYNYNGYVTDTTQPVVKQLKAGWNLIGTPFDRNYPWGGAAIRVNGTEYDLLTAFGYGFISNVLFGQNDDGYHQVTMYDNLEPEQGYWLRAYVDMELLLDPGAGMERGIARVSMAENPVIWRVKLSANSGIGNDIDNYLGVTSVSSTGFDSWDVMEPPGMGTYVSLGFDHRDWPVQEGIYANDFRPLTPVMEWPVVVQVLGEGAGATTVELRWEGIDSASGCSFKLIDGVKEVVMSEGGSYQVTGKDSSLKVRAECGAATSIEHYNVAFDSEPVSAVLPGPLTAAQAAQMEVYKLEGGQFVLIDPTSISGATPVIIFPRNGFELNLESAGSQVEVSLSAGWNLVANPFAGGMAFNDGHVAFKVGSSNLKLSEAGEYISDFAYVVEAGQYRKVPDDLPQILPGQSFLIYCDVAGTLVLTR